MVSGVDVVVFLIVLNEPSVAAESGKIFDGLVVDAWVVLVGARLEVDFGLYDMVERTRVAFGLGTASALSSTSYGRDATCVTISRGGRMPLNGFTFAMVYFGFRYSVSDRGGAYRSMVSVRSGPTETMATERPSRAR